jgi:hypothetical protein
MARRLVIILTALVAALAVPGTSYARARASIALQPTSGDGRSAITAGLRGTSGGQCGASQAVFFWDGVKVAEVGVDRRTCTAVASFTPPANRIKPGKHQVSGRFVGMRGADSATYTVTGAATAATPGPTHIPASALAPPPPPVAIPTQAPIETMPAGTDAPMAQEEGSSFGMGYILGILAVLAGAAVAGYAIWLVFKDKGGGGLRRRFRPSVYGAGAPAQPGGGPVAGAAAFGAGPSSGGPAYGHGVEQGATAVLPVVRAGQPEPDWGGDAAPTAPVQRTGFGGDPADRRSGDAGWGTGDAQHWDSGRSDAEPTRWDSDRAGAEPGSWRSGEGHGAPGRWDSGAGAEPDPWGSDQAEPGRWDSGRADAGPTSWDRGAAGTDGDWGAAGPAGGWNPGRAEDRDAASGQAEPRRWGSGHDEATRWDPDAGDAWSGEARGERGWPSGDEDRYRR